jgi:tetratricopeptide (TPR) repeat protein
MYHDIEREPLAFFLRDVNLKKLSGHLFVTAKDFQISLNFMEGKLANGMSTRFDEKISVILHLMGTINEEQYNFLSGLHQFSDDQVAGILLDHNFARKKDIYYARIYQLRRIAISTFALQRGKWIFTAGEPDPPLREAFEIPLAGILVEGARAVDHISFYANKWQQAIPVLFQEIPLDSEMYFTDAEREFYAAVQRQGRRRCQEHIARLNMLPLDFWRSILAFHLMGIVKFEKEEGAPDLSEEIAALLELNRKMQDAATDDLGLLGLAAHAAAAEIGRAKAGLLARFAPERFGSAAAPEIKSIADAVCQRLQAIKARLEAEADLATRPGLREEDIIVEAEMPAWPGPQDEERLVIRLEEPAEPELLSEAHRIVEAEDAAEPELLSEEDIIVEAGAESAPELLKDADLIAEPDMAAGPETRPEPPVRLQVEPELQIEMEIEPEQSEAEPEPAAGPPRREFAPVAAPPSLRMATAEHEKAWDLLLQSKELFERHECAKAVPLLKKAIKLEANQGDYYYLLGLCQSEAELTRNEAETNLKKAIELKSWSADPVYALGVLYRGQGKMKLAERCFQRVKEISYEHTGASRALIDLRRRKARGAHSGGRKKRT